ncbi:MAG: molybdopterin-dependent oxidoreductase [Granulosicoccaceae bacterium]
MSQYQRSTCPHDCPSACGLLVERLGPDRIGRVKGDPDHGYTRGVICAKVSRYQERNHHAGRLNKPLLRVGKKGVGIEAFEPISWDQALDRVAAEMRSASESYGPESVWPYKYAGTMGLIQLNALVRLRNLAGYSVQKETICVGLSGPGCTVGTGKRQGVDPREIPESELVVLWGCNAVHTQVNVMHYVSQAKKNGAKLVVIDPYLNATAEKADAHLMLKPGTDAALACAVMHVLIAEELADFTYLAQYTDADEDFYTHIASKSPEWAAEITGLSAQSIREFARLYGSTKRSFVRAGYGLSRSRNGAMSMHAVMCLPAVTGAWMVRGGGALQGTGVHEFNFHRLQGLDKTRGDARELDQSRIGPILDGTGEEMQGAAPVKCLLIQNTNPMAVAPASKQVRAGFEREDLFICVHEQFMTETAAMADIVLPATTFVEHDDIYASNGHTFLGLGPKLIDGPGEAKPNTWVIQQLAQRLGLTHEFFSMTDAEQVEALLSDSDYPETALFEDHVRLDCALHEDEAHFRDGFKHQDKRFHFRADWAAVGDSQRRLPSLPDFVDNIEKISARCPFRLVTAPARWFLNTSFTEVETSQRREGGEPYALVHPDDLLAQGIAEGELLEVGNHRAQLQLLARSFAGLQRGVVVVHSVWPSGHFIGGLGVNALVGADSPPPNGGAAFHDTAVWIKAVAAT